jgi:hypothetical protein
MPHAVYDKKRDQLYLQVCAGCRRAVPEDGESAHVEGCDQPGVAREIVEDYAE